MWQNIAFILIGVGILILIGWGAKDFFTASEIPLAIRIASGVIGVGVLVLIGVAVKERITRAKTEKFKGVDR
jgi:hypothetical protein